VKNKIRDFFFIPNLIEKADAIKMKLLSDSGGQMEALDDISSEIQTLLFEQWQGFCLNVNKVTLKRLQKSLRTKEKNGVLNVPNLRFFRI